MAQPQIKSPLTDPAVVLTILSGPEAGVAYKLMGQNIALGRSGENDVILRDSKSSRSHALIEKRDEHYWIVDLDSKTGVFVNGTAIKEGPLKPGDQITLGETELRFGQPQGLSLVNAAPPTPPHELGPLLTPAAPTAGQGSPPWLPPLTGNPALRPLGQPTVSPNTPRRGGGFKPQGANKNGNLIWGLVVVAIIIGTVAMQKHSETQHRKGAQIKGDADFDEQLEVTTDANDKTQQEILRKGKDTQQYSEAQAFYLRGFREFRESNYGRAIQNFQAALALYPNHPLAKRYLERSILKNSELVTAALERGEKDFQLQRYNNAFNEYRTVILLTNDARSKDYQLAQRRIEAIQLILVNSK